MNKDYEQNFYKVVKGAVPASVCAFLYTYCQIRRMVTKTMINTKYPRYYSELHGSFGERQVPEAFALYGDPVMDSLLAMTCDAAKKAIGLNLEPTYTYWRLYETGHELRRHKDRGSCQHSATLCLGINKSNLKDQSYSWPMYVGPKDGRTGTDGKPVFLEPGDILFYNGCQLEHWREPLTANNQAQVFLHYVDKDGPLYESCKFDGRPHLGLPGAYKDPHKYMEAIDIVGENYDNKISEEQKAQIRKEIGLDPK